MIVWLGSMLLLLSGILATVFVVLYWVTAPWWRTPMGRNIQALMMVIALVLDLSVIRVFVPVTTDVAWFAILRLVVFAFVPVVLAQRLWLLIRIQILDRKRERADADRRR